MGGSSRQTSSFPSSAMHVPQNAEHRERAKQRPKVCDESSCSASIKAYSPQVGGLHPTCQFSLSNPRPQVTNKDFWPKWVDVLRTVVLRIMPPPLTIIGDESGPSSVPISLL